MLRKRRQSPTTSRSILVASREPLTLEHPILDVIFTVDGLKSMAPYVPGAEPVYYGLVNENGDIALRRPGIMTRPRI